MKQHKQKIDIGEAIGLVGAVFALARDAKSAVEAARADGNVTPEAGQTTTIKCYKKGTNTLIAQYTGISGTSYSIPYYDLLGHREVDIMPVAVRDGFESLQGLRHEVLFNFFGYGNNYGNDYGENDG